MRSWQVSRVVASTGCASSNVFTELPPTGKEESIRSLREFSRRGRGAPRMDLAQTSIEAHKEGYDFDFQGLAFSGNMIEMIQISLASLEIGSVRPEECR